jgi:hypothetical protein
LEVWADLAQYMTKYPYYYKKHIKNIKIIKNIKKHITVSDCKR